MTNEEPKSDAAKEILYEFTEIIIGLSDCDEAVAADRDVLAYVGRIMALKSTVRAYLTRADPAVTDAELLLNCQSLAMECADGNLRKECDLSAFELAKKYRWM